MSERGALVRAQAGGAEPDGHGSPDDPRWRRLGQLPGANLRPIDAPSARRWPLVAVVALALTTSLGVGAAVLTHAGETAFSRQLGAGCEDVEPCRRLEAVAERLLAGCLISCGRIEAELRMARSLRYRAEERRAVRDHYRQREAAERLEQQTQHARHLGAWQREQDARLEAADREHRRRLELERLKQEHIDRRLLEQRQRKVSYFELLGAAGRAKRLQRCGVTARGCDGFILELLEAARDEAEKRSLAELYEKLLAGEVPAVAPPAPAPASAPPASAPATS